MKTAKISSITFSYYKVIGILALALSFIAFTNATNAQTYKSVAGSLLKVEGTSNLHDWVMQAQNVPAEAELTFKGEQLQNINALNITLPVTNLKAKEDLMNTRAYKALNAEKYNKITFKLSSATVSPAQNNQYTVKANGVLTISGVSKDVALQVKAVENADGSITFTGSRKIKMSEFGIKPPSFMLGALKVGDEVTVDFTLKLKK